MPFSLCCLILGDDKDMAFIVKIQENETVSTLKEMIKKEKKSRLAGVDAADLKLWKVNLPLDNVTTNLAQLVLDRASISSPAKKLSSIFNNILEDDLHIVVKAPEFLVLNCLFLGDSLEYGFNIEIAKTMSVATLKEMIKEKKKSQLADVGTGDLKLWKVDVDPSLYDVEAQLAQLKIVDVDAKDLDTSQVSVPMDHDAQERPEPPTCESLAFHLLLSEVFPRVEKGHIHILVESEKRLHTTVVVEEDRRDKVSALNKRLENILSRIRDATPHSDSAKTSAYAKSQIAYSIYDGRYKAQNARTSIAPPVQLFHPAFGHFLDDIEDRTAIPDDVVRQTTAYMVSASAIYTNEEERRNILAPLLIKVLDIDIQVIQNEDKMVSDSISESLTSHGCILLLLKEDKNEFGDGGSDPSTQAGLSVGRCWAQAKFEKIRQATCCPTFMIATAGPWIAILGSVITDGVIVQRLTDFVWAGLDSVLNYSRIIHVARVLLALKASLKKLDSYYRNLRPPTDNLPVGSRYFPSLTAYLDGTETVTFEYIGFLENSPDSTTLRARAGTRDIVVKFVVSYGKQAHSLLADAGLAPKLLYCGSPHLKDDQPSYRGLMMVVMEYVDGDTLAVLSSEPLSMKKKNAVWLAARTALDMLHKKNLVFGDLRPPNIMINKKGEVMVIDFDSAGEEGEVKYPHFLSPRITWPEGVKPLDLIKREHDWDMLKRLV